MPRIDSLNGKLITECSPEELREAARGWRTRVEESFQNCDTDGFLSQWADSMTAQIYERQARINENGGLIGRAVLVDMETGDVVSRDFRLGGEWIDGPNGRFQTSSQWVLPKWLREKCNRYAVPAGKKSRVQKALGLAERVEMVPGFAGIGGGGKGLAGAASAYVTNFAVDEAD